MNTQELKEQLDALYETFSVEHSGKSKAAHGRARKALGEIKKSPAKASGEQSIHGHTYHKSSRDAAEP